MPTVRTLEGILEGFPAAHVVLDARPWRPDWVPSFAGAEIADGADDWERTDISRRPNGQLACSGSIAARVSATWMVRGRRITGRPMGLLVRSPSAPLHCHSP